MNAGEKGATKAVNGAVQTWESDQKGELHNGEQR